MDARTLRDQRQYLVSGQHRAQILHPDARLTITQNRDLGLTVGVTHPNPHEEPVQLCLGQRIGAVHVDRVLGRHDEERPRHRMRLAVNGDPPLLHHLQQRRLCLG